MEIAKLIIKVLSTNPVIVFSWGFSDIRMLEDGVIFYVNGYIHKGDVEVKYKPSSDTFRIRTIKLDGQIGEIMENVYISDLVDTIDKMVEYCENYEQRVTSDYIAKHGYPAEN